MKLSFLKIAVSFGTKRQPERTSQMRRETVHKRSFGRTERAPTRALAEIEGDDEVVARVKRDHRIVGDILRSENVVVKGGALQWSKRYDFIREDKPAKGL